jgi:hypothetical protein
MSPSWTYLASARHCLTLARSWRRMEQHHLADASRTLARLYIAQARDAKRREGQS